MESFCEDTKTIHIIIKSIYVTALKETKTVKKKRGPLISCVETLGLRTTIL